MEQNASPARVQYAICRCQTDPFRISMFIVPRTAIPCPSSRHLAAGKEIGAIMNTGFPRHRQAQEVPPPESLARPAILNLASLACTPPEPLDKYLVPVRQRTFRKRMKDGMRKIEKPRTSSTRAPEDEFRFPHRIRATHLLSDILKNSRWA